MRGSLLSCRSSEAILIILLLLPEENALFSKSEIRLSTLLKFNSRRLSSMSCILLYRYDYYSTHLVLHSLNNIIIINFRYEQHDTNHTVHTHKDKIIFVTTTITIIIILL